MEIIPAIDLLDGKCVRLYQGDYSKETIYSESPESVAVQWAQLGANRLHVVDLDGAKTGKPTNLEAIQSIVEATNIPIQLGGGIRTLASAKEAMNMGVDRIIVGTVAIEQPALVAELCVGFGAENIIVGVDSKDGNVAVRGWMKGTSTSVLELTRNMADIGVKRIMYTDVSRDGTLTAPNYRVVKELVDRSGLRILAAGGIGTTRQLIKLAHIGVEATIVGKALYTGNVNLVTALRDVSNISTKGSK